MLARDRVIYSAIAFQITKKCNASCKICDGASGPSLNARMDTDVILKNLDAVKNIKSIRLIAITGGEPFLYLDDIMLIAERCKAIGRQLLIVTNASWCSSYPQTLQILSQLKKNNLAICYLSADKFHQEFVPIACLKNFLRACRTLDISVQIQAVLTKSTFADTDEVIKNIGEDKLRAQVLFGAVYPVGRAREQIEPEDFYTKKLDNALCPYQYKLYISTDGRAHPCCSPCFYGIPFDCGNIYTDSLVDILKKTSENELMRIIVSEGFSGLIKDANEALGFKPLAEYVDICHLCNHLLADKERYTFLSKKYRMSKQG